MLKNIPQSKKKIFKYLLIGSKGLLGSQLKILLPKKDSIFLARNKSNYNIDLSNLYKLEKLFKSYRFTNVINAAAITDLEYCQKKKNLCKKINYHLPLKLESFSRKYHFKLTHISTDQVYISSHQNKHKETDKTGYFNYYSKMKYLSELQLKKNFQTLLIRTNFTGFKKKTTSTFIGWIYKSIENKKKITLFNDLFCSTIDVKTCAQIIKKLIDKNKKGIFNVGTSDSLSKKDFAILFAKKLKKKIYFNEISANKTSLKRPLNLRLNVRKIEKILKTKMITSSKSINNLISQKKI